MKDESRRTKDERLVSEDSVFFILPPSSFILSCFGGLPVLGLLFVFVVIFLASAVVLWGGTFVLQAYIYSNPSPDLYWRAPLAAAVVTAFLGFWTMLDYRRPGSFNTLFEFSARDDQAYDKFWSVKNKQEILYVSHKTGQGRTEYRDPQGKPWVRSDTEGLVEAIVVEEPDGRKTRFVAETQDGKFSAKQGEPVRYREEGGKRIMTDQYIGKLSATRWGLVIGNILLNFGHFIAWFVVLWLLLRFQWPHAFGLALALWAMFMFVLPALFTKAEDVAKARAVQMAQRENSFSRDLLRARTSPKQYLILAHDDRMSPSFNPFKSLEVTANVKSALSKDRG
jgi:hypothetical protein